MTLTRLTISGADDGVDPAELVKLSAEFPFVEWGILWSGSRTGTPRYPSIWWRDNLIMAWCKGGKPSWALSAHFCGSIARETMAGSDYWLDGLDVQYGRVQLNGFAVGDVPMALVELMKRDRHERLEFILQVRDDLSLSRAAWIAGNTFLRARVRALWDPSGGTGKQSINWPSGLSCEPAGGGRIPVPLGGAGGINRGNIVKWCTQAAQREEETWLDLETGARTADDRFSLDDVREILTIARPYIGRTACPNHKYELCLPTEGCAVCANST